MKYLNEFNIINEARFYFSVELEKVLNVIDSPISKDILSKEGNDVEPNITSVDLSDQDGYITFTTAENTKKILDIEDSDYVTDKVLRYKHYNKLRSYLSKDKFDKVNNNMKIGKFVNRLFKGSYTDKQIEDFVNMFKAVTKKEDELFELVKGDEIKKWYNYSNYYSDSGHLGSSCMRNKDPKFFDIFSENPEVCQLLILKKDDKILGRALVWKTDKGIFMDRQYTNFEHDVEKFKNYAKEKGWLFKTANSVNNYNVTDNKGNESIIHMKVSLKKCEFDYYPYMDTFKILNCKENVLKTGYDGESGEFRLEETDGERMEIDDTTWSSYYNDYLENPDDAVWSEAYSSYLDRYSSIYIEGRGWFPDDSEDISYVDRYGDYFHYDDVIWSNTLNEYVLSVDSIVIIKEVSSKGLIFELDYVWYDFEDPEYFEFEYVDFLASYNEDWSDVKYINIDYTMDLSNEDFNWTDDVKSYDLKLVPTYLVFEVFNSEKGYMSRLDAKILEMDLDTDDMKLTVLPDYLETDVSKEVFEKLKPNANQLPENKFVRYKMSEHNNLKGLNNINIKDIMND
jgi:hypothetical protein